MVSNLEQEVNNVGNRRNVSCSSDGVK